MSYFNTIEMFGDSIALLDDSGKKLSYNLLAEESDKIYKENEVEARSLVFILCSNTVDSVCGYVGALRNDIVPVLVDADLTEELFQHLYATYEPNYVWLPYSKTDLVSGQVLFSSGSYSLVKTSYVDKPVLYSELGLLLTTSGSTGSPKLVRQSYKNIASNTAAIIEYLDIKSDDRPITTLPMNYTYGLSIITSHLMAGATILMTGRTFMEKEFWSFFDKERATTFGGVPYTYQMLKRLRFFNRDLSHVRYLTQAGGKLPYELSLEVATKCKEKGIAFIVMYGQTEATARMAYLPKEYAIEKCGCMGIPIPGGKFWLQDEDGSIIDGPDAVGELVYQGDNVTLGYAECREDLAKGDERHGVLVTGDMAKRDADGFYAIVGRKKRFVKIFGSRVNLDETERLLAGKGFTCACAGVDDKMAIYTEDEGKETEILHEVSHLLNINASAFSVKYIASIPKNDAGKTLYSALEKL